MIKTHRPGNNDQHMPGNEATERPQDRGDRWVGSRSPREIRTGPAPNTTPGTTSGSSNRLFNASRPLEAKACEAKGSRHTHRQSDQRCDHARPAGSAGTPLMKRSLPANGDVTIAASTPPGGNVTALPERGKASQVTKNSGCQDVGERQARLRHSRRSARGRRVLSTRDHATGRDLGPTSAADVDCTIKSRPSAAAQLRRFL